MKKIFLFVLIGFMTLWLGCRQEPANKNEKVKETTQVVIEDLKLLSEEEGLVLLKSQCYTCHSPQSKSHDKMLAPPLAGIKYKYLQHYPDRTTFIAKMSDFVNEPTKENAAMKGPVRRFGLMPEVPLELEQIRQITAFIYDNELEVPAWFPEHFEDQHGEEWKH